MATMPDATITVHVSETVSDPIRALYIARRRACITEANAIAVALGLDLVRTESEWRRRETGQDSPPPPPAPVKVSGGRH